MLSVGKVLLKINLLKRNGAFRRLEALAELRHMKHIMNICKVGRELELIG